MNRGSETKPSSFKRGRLEIRSGEPLAFIEDPGIDVADSEPPVELQEAASQVAATLKAYRDSAKELLSGKYSELWELTPSHLREPCNITIMLGSDGMVVRFDLSGENEPKVRWGASTQTLAELAPALSERFVHFPPDEMPYDPGEGGIELHLEKVEFETGEVEPISSVRLFAFAKTRPPESFSPPPPPSRPAPLVSLTNQLSVYLAGLVVPADSTSVGNVAIDREFVAKSAMKLAVGWQAFEVYPPVEAGYWKPEFAPVWAENDLLAAVARYQLVETQLASIDPNVAARNAFSRTLQELQELLSGPEEPAHQYLKQHPELLCPAHTACWSKLPLGDNVTDFVFRQPGNEYLLVEIESPLRRLFRKDGQQRHELTHAFNQISDWRIFIEDNLRLVQEEVGLHGISANSESLIVIGRSYSLTETDRRKIVALQNQIPKLRILTYDDLIQNAKAVGENLFGPLDLTGDNVTIYYAPSGSVVGPFGAKVAGTAAAHLAQRSRGH